MKRLKEILGYTNFGVYTAVLYFIIGAFDAFFDLDMFTFIWLATGIFTLQLTMYFDQLRKDIDSGYCEEKLKESK